MTTQTLFLSTDRKVTNRATSSGNAAIANAFGLLAGSANSCPGATAQCETVCYAGALETQYKNVLSRMRGNLDMLQGKSVWEMASMLAVMVNGFVVKSNRQGAPLLFRIHWDGDFFSRDYALAWRYVVMAYPEVTFWVYTRSFREPVNVLDLITGLDNLTVYLSADSDNVEDAREMQKRFPSVHLAILARTFNDAKGMTNGNKAYRCPEIDRRIPLITEKGSACARCGVCVFGRGDVLFSSSKK